MPFEKIESAGRGRGQGNVDPMISLRKSGSIGINNAALEEYFEDAEAVYMHYDEEKNWLGLEPLEEKEDGAYTLSRSDSGGSVTPTSVLNRYNLVPDITTQYRPEVHKQNQYTELVYVDLDEPIGTYGTPAEEEEAEAEAEADD